MKSKNRVSREPKFSLEACRCHSVVCGIFCGLCSYKTKCLNSLLFYCRYCCLSYDRQNFFWLSARQNNLCVLITSSVTSNNTWPMNLAPGHEVKGDIKMTLYMCHIFLLGLVQSHTRISMTFKLNLTKVRCVWTDLSFLCHCREAPGNSSNSCEW